MSQFERLQKAAALKYSDNGENSAPVVVASGSGHVAQTIIGIAEKSGVPVFRDNSLATLLSQLQADTEIPPELYQAVVDIYVYFLGFRVDQNGKVVRGSTPEPLPAEPSPEDDQIR
jgi:flagellar biosynthesis protein